MALGWKTRRRLALAILLLGLPVYVVVAITVIGLFERPSPLVEAAVYLGLGIVWALPLRAVFRGIGKPDPQARDDAKRPGE